jgi:hypothetical protein
MNKKEFVEHLNKITKETNSPLLYHRTPFTNLESILKDGALLPLESREKKNYNYGSSVTDVLTKEQNIEYDKSIFVAFKNSKVDINKNEFFIGNKDSAYFLFNPYDIDEEIFKNSIFCENWNYGLYDENICGKWDSLKDKKSNIEILEGAGYISEIVVKNSKGFNFNDIIGKNPSGVMIVVKSMTKDKEIKKLMKQYPQYQWILVNKEMYPKYEMIYTFNRENLPKILKNYSIKPLNKNEYESLNDNDKIFLKDIIYTTNIYSSVYKKVKKTKRINYELKDNKELYYIILDIENMEDLGLFDKSFYCNFKEKDCISFNKNENLESQLEKWSKMSNNIRDLDLNFEKHLFFNLSGIYSSNFKYIVIKDEEILKEMKEKYPYIEFRSDFE